MSSPSPNPPRRTTPADMGREAGSRLAGFSVRYPVTICMVFVLFLTLGGISVFKIPLVLMPPGGRTFSAGQRQPSEQHAAANTRSHHQTS